MDVYLTTLRMHLRGFDPAAHDAEFLWELDGDPAVTRFTLTVRGTRAMYRDRVVQYRQGLTASGGRLGYFVAVARDGWEPKGELGWFHLKPVADDPSAAEVGYRLKRVVWGQGYATEGTRALLDKAFGDLGLERVLATALAANGASIRVMEKAGMVYEDHYQHRHTDGTAYAAVRYGMRRAEWVGGGD